MRAKTLLAGIVLTGTIAASIAGGVLHGAHAISPAPSTYDVVNPFNPVSVEVVGTRFTPGGAVHLDLIEAPETLAPEPTPDGSTGPIGTPASTPTPETVPGTPQVVASLDTRAARTTYIPNGHGIVFTRAGGYFDVTLTPTARGCGMFFMWTVATDEATGATSATRGEEYGTSCN